MSDSKKISELETGVITENSYFLNTIIDDVNGNSSTKVGVGAMKAAIGDTVFIEFPDEYPEDIETLPEGITGKYIYDLVHAGKRVILVCGKDSGDGRFHIPVNKVWLHSSVYSAYASLVYPQFSGNPSALTYVGCYSITINDSVVLAHYEYFNKPT